MSDKIKTIVGYETYKKFAKKYDISPSSTSDGNRKKKTIIVLRNEIKKFEKKKKIKNGLYY